MRRACLLRRHPSDLLVAGNDKLPLHGVSGVAVGQPFAAIGPVATGARVIRSNEPGGTEFDVGLLGGT